MNFRDVVIAMVLIEVCRPGLGIEYAGIVCRVGSSVTDLNVSDRIMAFHHGCFATRIIVSTQRLVKIPDDLTFDKAATRPCVYTTVLYFLLTVSGLRRGQSVLIHSACGEVGLPLCMCANSLVYATVGTSEKRRTSRRTLVSQIASSSIRAIPRSNRGSWRLSKAVVLI